MVGCVIVQGGRIIGEGFTSPYGGPHAEVNAIRAVRQRDLLPKAALYVSLEPCSHHGKTPPCVDLILGHKIPEVYIGLRDPHDKVAGQGIAKLLAAGVKVEVGILEDRCREHHRRFLCQHEKNRPYVLLKWAESQDGYMAPPRSARKEGPQPHWISNAHSKQLVHKWRSEEQAILVGKTTVLDDDPKLSVRDWAGRDPLRIVLDPRLEIPGHYHVLDGSVATLVLTKAGLPMATKKNISYDTLDFTRPLASQICGVLHRRAINSVLVEGGAKTLQAFLDEGLWDEARVFVGPGNLGGGLAAPRLPGRPRKVERVLTDTLSLYYHD